MGFYFDWKSIIASITALTHNFWMAAFLPYWEDYRNEIAIFFIIGFNWFFKCLLLGVLMVVGLQQMMIYRYSGNNPYFTWDMPPKSILLSFVLYPTWNNIISFSMIYHVLLYHFAVLISYQKCNFYQHNKEV